MNQITDLHFALEVIQSVGIIFNSLAMILLLAKEASRERKK